MTKESTGLSFSFEDFDAAPTADMDVQINGRATGWIWSFAGPGHPQTVAAGNKRAKENLRIEAEQNQARVNGRKWKAPEESVDEVKERNIGFVVDRLVGWSDVEIGGAKYPYTTENARKLLSDPNKVSLLLQAYEFLGTENAFTKR